MDSLTPAQTEQYKRSLKTVVGQSERVIVGITKDDGVGWQLIDGHLTPEDHLLVARFTRRWASVKDAVPEDRIASHRALLANALFHSLNAEKNAQAVFEQFAGRVDEAVTVRQVTAYLYGGLLTAVILIVSSLIAAAGTLPAIEGALTLGSIPGMLGAFTSVLLKTNAIVPEQQLPKWFARVQGASRVALGALFGVIAYLGVRGGLVAGVVADSDAVIFVLALAAGFSERWAPDLLGTISDRARLAGGTDVVDRDSDQDTETNGEREARSRGMETPTEKELLEMLPEDPAGEPGSTAARATNAPRARPENLLAVLPDDPDATAAASLLAELPDDDPDSAKEGSG